MPLEAHSNARVVTATLNHLHGGRAKPTRCLIDPPERGRADTGTLDDNDTLLEFDAAWCCHAAAFSQKPCGGDFPIDSATSICPLFL
jgi:hypothetical protein